MKKHITAFVVLALAFTTSFANNNKPSNIDERVEKSFKKEFATAQQESWTRVNDLYKVQFTMNGQVLFAYLNEEGNIVGIYRNIITSQLPISLMTKVKDQYASYWVSSLFEVANQGTTTYYITLENADQQLVLKSENSIDWTSFSKNKK